MTPSLKLRHTLITALAGVMFLSGITCTAELTMTDGGTELQCIPRTSQRVAKGLYGTVADLPEVDRLSLILSDPADRAQTIEQDLRFVEVEGPWAIYEITGPNPRLYMPGIIDMTQPTTQMCPGTVWGEFEQSYYSFDPWIRVSGKWVNEASPRVITDHPTNAMRWHGQFICDGPFDVLGGNAVPSGRVDYTFIDFEVPPPIGSVFSFRMITTGPHSVPKPNIHGDHDPPLCCTEQSGCCIVDDPNCPPTQWPYCGDRNVDPGEQCDDGNNLNGDGCSATCTIEPYCGDGTKNPGEQCDDGNNANGDGCSATCTIEPYCGDGTQDPGEACDDGLNNGQPGFCNATCTGIEPPDPTPYCGDGTQDPGEACDDGTNNGKPGFCNATCTGIEPPDPSPYCGDGTQDPGEACDDGNASDTDGCLNTCVLARCGDGVVQAGVEACDDGNTVDFDACRNACLLPECGDGVISTGETCDDGADNGQPGLCKVDCTGPGEPPNLSGTCGDGIINGTEVCDDGADNGQPGFCRTNCSGASEPANPSLPFCDEPITVE